MSFNNLSYNSFLEEFKKKTIPELDHIIRNNHKFSAEEVLAANNIIPLKRAELKNYNRSIADQIQKVIELSGENYFDFEIYKYDGMNLIMAGNYDLTYNHSLEIIFEDVWFVSANFYCWSADYEKPIIELPTLEKEKELRIIHQTDQDHQFFIMHPEDQNDIIIAANKISFNQDPVYYYLREDLKENERIADFVLRN